MKIQTGITAKNLNAVTLALNKLLADEYVLYTKTRNYHWNVEGSNFMEMHQFYESQYEQLDAIIDEVAERVRALGHYAEGRLKDLLKLANLLEPQYTSDQKAQLTNLLNDHETLIRLLRKLIRDFAGKYHDDGSCDFVTGLLGKHEKMAWMIRAYLS